MIWLLCAAVCTAADLCIKSYFRKHPPEETYRRAAGGRVEFKRMFNSGLLGSRCAGDKKTVKSVSILGTVLLAGVLASVLASEKSSAAEKAGVSILAGGAAGNLAERFRYGNVTDYIRIRTDRKAGRFVFNLADIMIAAGGIIAVIAAFFERTE